MLFFSLPFCPLLCRTQVTWRKGCHSNRRFQWYWWSCSQGIGRKWSQGCIGSQTEREVGCLWGGGVYLNFVFSVNLFQPWWQGYEKFLDSLYRLDKIRDEIAEMGDVAVSVATDVVNRQEVYNCVVFHVSAMPSLKCFSNATSPHQTRLFVFTWVLLVWKFRLILEYISLHQEILILTWPSCWP